MISSSIKRPRYALCHTYFKVLYEKKSQTLLPTKATLQVLNILSTPINQHTSKQTACCFHTFFWIDELHVHYGWGPQIFQKRWGHFKNFGISDIKDTQNLNYRYSLGVKAHDLKIGQVCLLPHPELQVTFIPGDTWNAEFTCILKAGHTEIQDCY